MPHNLKEKKVSKPSYWIIDLNSRNNTNSAKLYGEVIAVEILMVFSK